jgi:hypothetical protein
VGITMQDVGRQHRQQDLIRHPQEIGGAHQQEDGADGGKAPRVAHASVRLDQDRGPGWGDRTRRQAHRPDRGQHGRITQAVEEKTAPFAYTDNQEASDGGADKAGAIGQHGVEREGVAEVLLLVHEVDHQGLTGGHIDSIDHAQHDTEAHHLPERGDICQHQPGQPAGLEHGEDLGHQE